MAAGAIVRRRTEPVPEERVESGESVASAELGELAPSAV
jgi:hypothetical protein